MSRWTFNYYAKNQQGVFPATEIQAYQLNESSHDIFWTPQEFKEFGKRKIVDLKAVRFVCGDFDHIAFEQLARKLRFLPEPTFVIATRGGFHVYWALQRHIPAGERVAEMYRSFIETRLIPIGTDKQAKDVSRLLRPPFARYWWDSKGNFYGNEKIFTRTVHECGKEYLWEDLERYFPIRKHERIEQETAFCSGLPKPRSAGAKPSTKGDSFWQRANELDPKRAIEALSGTDWVRHEEFSFRSQSGLLRILTNGKPCNAWIDRRGLIGSTTGAGPTIVNWLKYYGHTEQIISEILKTFFPELNNK